jgi:hypothetical protein
MKKFKKDDDELLNATFSQDLAIFQKNYEFMLGSSLQFEEKWLRLYAILADSDTMHEMKYALEENDQYLEKKGLSLHYLFKPMRGDFQYYKEVDLKNDTDKEIREHGSEIKSNPKGAD